MLSSLNPERDFTSVALPHSKLVVFLSEILSPEDCESIPQTSSHPNFKPLNGSHLNLALCSFDSKYNTTNNEEQADEVMINKLMENGKIIDRDVAASVAYWLKKSFRSFTERKVLPYPQLMDIQKFKALLQEEGVTRPNDEVIDRIVDHFTLRFYAVSTSKRAFDLYDFVNNLPTTTIKVELEKDYGIKLNVLYDPNFYSTIITGADREGVPLLVKILTGSKIDNERELTTVKNLGLENPPEGTVSVKICSVTLEGKNFMNKFANGMYSCLVMPHYPRNLALMSKMLTYEVILKGGQLIKRALEIIHKKGLVHMDVKPANIFVSNTGEWVLGDFGSCVEIGNTVISCSNEYLPEKVLGKPARIGFDYFMLAMSMLALIVDLKQLLNDSIMLVNLNKVRGIISGLSYEPLKQFIEGMVEEGGFDSNE